MAITAQQYQSMRRALRIKLSVEGIGPTDADVLSFSKQLLTDSAGATPLSTARNFLATEVLRTALSADFSPTDSNVSDFITQLATDSSSSTPMGLTKNYRSMRNALRAEMSGGGLNPTDADVLGYFAPYGSIDFVALFPGTILRAIQGDLGVTSVAGVVTTVADRGPNGWGVSSTAANNRPIVNTGFNGRATILFDGVDDELHGTLILPDASITSYYIYSIFKPATQGAQQTYIGNASGKATLASTGNISNLFQYGGVGVGPSDSMTAALTRVYAEFTASIADRMKSGSNAFVTGINVGGAADPAGVGIIGAGTVAGGFPAIANVALVVHGLGALTTPQMIAIDVAAANYWGALVA